jgi:hypothetical protein
MADDDYFAVDAAYIKAQAREAMRVFFAPLTFLWRLARGMRP